MDNKITAKFLLAYGFMKYNLESIVNEVYRLRLHDGDDDDGMHQGIQVNLEEQTINLVRKPRIEHDVTNVFECPQFTIAALKDFYKGLTGDDLTWIIYPGCVVCCKDEFYLVLPNVDSDVNIPGRRDVFSLNNNRIFVKSIRTMEFAFNSLKEYYEDLSDAKDNVKDYHM